MDALNEPALKAFRRGQRTPLASIHPGSAESEQPLTVGVFEGEGIGPEVVAAALEVLQTLSRLTGRGLDIRVGGPIGRAALEQHGKSLTDEAVAFAESTFADGGALFCGAGSARFVYDLRTRFDLFCKLTPLVPLVEMSDAALVRAEKLQGVDILAVRENAGGLYFGRERVIHDATGKRVEMSFGYSEAEVARILEVAERMALRRRKQVCVVVKRDGVAAISELWMERTAAMQGRSDIGWEILDIDNAAYQLIADPGRFDVLVSPNMFGDVLADCGAVLLGSRGMSYSGNFSADGRAVFQTGHGAAYDLAGTDRANPLGQILALAMMLQEFFHWPQGAALVRQAVAETLRLGVRTRDILGRGSRVVGCREMARQVCSTLEGQNRPT